mmetsp:Transcript_18309/g.41791  ORF Transcript_18309/g.41791 Transcript_18309/m.41791 type:complete len:80 (-) Transcript_18309:27-266(-)
MLLLFIENMKLAWKQTSPTKANAMAGRIAYNSEAALRVAPASDPFLPFRSVEATAIVFFETRCSFCCYSVLEKCLDRKS